MLLQNTVNAVTNLFFPKLCTGCCNDLYGAEEALCLSCIDKMPVTNFHFHANNPVEKIFGADCRLFLHPAIFISRKILCFNTYCMSLNTEAIKILATILEDVWAKAF